MHLLVELQRSGFGISQMCRCNPVKQILSSFLDSVEMRGFNNSAISQINKVLSYKLISKASLKYRLECTESIWFIFDWCSGIITAHIWAWPTSFKISYSWYFNRTNRSQVQYWQLSNVTVEKNSGSVGLGNSININWGKKEDHSWLCACAYNMFVCVNIFCECISLTMLGKLLLPTSSKTWTRMCRTLIKTELSLLDSTSSAHSTGQTTETSRKIKTAFVSVSIPHVWVNCCLLNTTNSLCYFLFCIVYWGYDRLSYTLC